MEKATPKLRFPDYIYNWKRCKLKDISVKINSGKTPLGGESVYTNSGILFIRSQNVLDSNLSFENSTYIDEKTNNTMKNSVVMPLDILLNITGASLGRSCVVPSNFTIGNVNQHVCIIRLTKDNNSNFIQSILASEIGQSRLRNLSTGSGREGLNFQSIKDFDIYLPSYDEQTKIASFLSAVDEKLNLLKEKKAALEEYKKGMMQKIFSQEIRFKDESGIDFAQWEDKKIRDIFKVTRGTVLSMTSVCQSPVGDNIYPVYSSQTKQNGLAGYYNSYIFEDAITWTTDGAGAGDVKFRKGKFYCTNVCGVLLNAEGYCNVLIAEILNSVSRNYVSYVGNPKLMNNVMAEISIFIPSEISEQNKIASFLSSIDEKITLVSEQIDEIVEYKKGLLQQMFC